MKKFKINGISVEAESIADAIHQMKDGAYSAEFIKVNSASEITLTKIVEVVKNVVKRYGSKVIKIESGRVTGRDKDTLQLSVFETTDIHNYETWSSLPLIFEIPYDLQAKLYKENPEYGRQKAMSEITKKLRTYENKTLYEDKTYRMDSLDSEDVEDLATVDKTFLLNLTRKIITNIQSDNFSTAQTQAKELERYINNVSYADSIDDFVNDSAASDIVREIRVKYPQVKVRQISKQRNGYHQTHLEFSNYPGEGATGFGNDPRTKERDNWTKFLMYLYTKYTGEKDELDVYYDRLDIYEDFTHDSVDDSIKDVPVGYEPKIESKTIISWKNMTQPNDLKELLKRYKNAKSSAEQMSMLHTIQNRIEEIREDYKVDKNDSRIATEELNKHYKQYNAIIDEINRVTVSRFAKF